MSNYNELKLTYEGGSQETITLTDSTIRLGEYQSRHIVSVEVPEIVERIDEYAFCDNNNLSAITLSEGLVRIGDQAFQHGVYTAVTIPSTVTYIGWNAFNTRDEQLDDQHTFTVTSLASTPPTLEDGEGITFGDPELLLAIYVPAGSVSAYQAEWPDYATKIQALPTPTPASGFSTLDIVSAYVGTEIVERLYMGDELVWGDEPAPVEDPMLRTPLTIEITDAGTAWLKTFGIRLSGVTTTTERDNNSRPLMYVLTRDGVKTTGYFNLSESVATSTSSVTSTVTVQTGDKLELYAKTKQGGTSVSTTIYQYFMTSNGMKVNVYGNVNSLLVTKTEFDDFDTATFVLSAYTFFRLFNSKTDFSFGAPADYYHILLPATTLASYCYSSMFGGCTSLTTAPELPATTLASYCYYSMFYNCTSLTTAPSLPATTLADYCYVYMFGGCTSLTTTPSILPATTLKRNCYQNMFSDCSSLTTAPELPAPALAYYCYYYMFYGCTSLNYIKCLATAQATNSTTGWLYNVSTTGTFVKHPNVTWSSGVSGIPSGWTVVDAE